MGAKTPGRTDPLIFMLVDNPRRNHVFQIWWRSVQGFSVGWGSNFAISHWLWRSSLYNSLALSCERFVWSSLYVYTTFALRFSLHNVSRYELKDHFILITPWIFIGPSTLLTGHGKPNDSISHIVFEIISNYLYLLYI